jgi:pyruvate dehydrogenase E2 component (dihydrolipoamide acetyltransferase)
MAEQVLMPRYGEIVESCIILRWLKKEGEQVAEGDALCEIEADKATFEVGSTVSGTFLMAYFDEGDDIPVFTPIAAIGKEGEDVSNLKASAAKTKAAAAPSAAGSSTPPIPVSAGKPDALDYPGEVREYPVRGARKIISEKMASSLGASAQFTMHASADARSILAYQEKLKNSKRRLKLRDITINDLVVFVAVKTLGDFPALNAHFLGDRIVEYSSVHAGFAVDTDSGVMVPVIRFADRLSLKELSLETGRLSKLCIYGGINPDDFAGGTVTITNLGVLGIEMFTPILHPPQAAILGICSIQQRPVIVGGETVFIPHIGLSLTVNHQSVDGAPAARYLKRLCEAIAGFELSLAG